MKHSGNFSFRNRLKSFKYAFKGLKILVLEEHNARIQVFALICVTVAGILLKLKTIEWLAVVIVFGMVLIAELFNTAIERMADFVEPKNNREIGTIKDLAAGAVLLTAISAAIVGALIFIPKILDMINIFFPK